MTEKPASPIRPTDDDARALARDLIGSASYAALAVLAGADTPAISRIAFGLGPNGEMLSLVSDLSAHAARLRTAPRCALLIGEPPDKGDPLAFARISVSAEATFVARTETAHGAYRDAWLAHHPKSALYMDFADFHFLRFHPLGAELNGGFGKAYHLTKEDLKT